MTSTEGWREVVNGEREASWSLWAEPIESASCLTEDGRVAARWAVGRLAQWLGDSWLQRSLRVGSPLMSLTWWPAHDAPRTFLGLIEFAAQVDLLRQLDGWKKLRKAARGDTTYWKHGLLQAEVAGLAVRGGFDVELEPLLSTGKNADLLITGDDSAWVIEMTALGPSRRFEESERLIDRLFQRLRVIEARRNVAIGGAVMSAVPLGALDAWITEVDQVAASVHETSRGRQVPVPGGGALEILPEGMTTDEPRQLRIRIGSPPDDVWPRVARTLERKDEQIRDQRPGWLRVDVGHELWFATIAAMRLPRSEMHAALAHNLRAVLHSLDHVEGIVLSGPRRLGFLPCEPGIITEGPDFFGAVYDVWGLVWREVVAVARYDEGGSDRLATWQTWYSTEGTWIDWAWERLELPSREAIFQPPS